MADISTDLALRGTFMAHERTLMAWIRTSTSLISFGFAYKFFEYLEGTGHALRPGGRFGPREYALSLITIGVVALAIAVVDYHLTLEILEREYGRNQRSLAGKLAVIIFVMGLGLLILALLHE